MDGSTQLLSMTIHLDNFAFQNARIKVKVTLYIKNFFTTPVSSFMDHVRCEGGGGVLFVMPC